MTSEPLSDRLKMPRPSAEPLWPVILALVIFLQGIAPAAAKEPAAMVEHVANGPDGLASFDYVYPGRVIDLGPDGLLSLIYFETCMREEIRGGRVTIREQGSVVRGSGQFDRTSLDCGHDRGQPDQRDRRTSAAMVFRGHADVEEIDHLAPRLLTSGDAGWLSIVEMPSQLEIFRLRRPDRCVDLGRHDITLAPGGAYRVETSSLSVIIRVAPDATEAAGSEPVRLAGDPAETIDGGCR